MENRESSYYRRDGASRPPQREGAASQRESALFTELPLDSVRRTPNSGRPAPQYTETETANRRSARPAAEPARTAPRAVPYTPQSRPAQGYADYNGYGSRQPQQRQQPYGGGSAAFTEISWDALRSGDLEQSAQGNRRAAPAQPQTDPYGRPVQPQREAYRPAAQPRQADPYYNAAQPQTDPYGRTAQPQQRNDPYRRSDGSYRQPYATGGYRKRKAIPFTAGVSRSGKHRRALTRLPSVRTGIITVPAPFAARHSAPLRDALPAARRRAARRPITAARAFPSVCRASGKTAFIRRFCSLRLSLSAF